MKQLWNDFINLRWVNNPVGKIIRIPVFILMTPFMVVYFMWRIIFKEAFKELKSFLFGEWDV